MSLTSDIHTLVAQQKVLISNQSLLLASLANIGDSVHQIANDLSNLAEVFNPEIVGIEVEPGTPTPHE